MPLSLTRHGLCRTVRERGAVTEQSVWWPGLGGVLLSGGERASVPMPPGWPTLHATFVEPDRVRLAGEGMQVDVEPERPFRAVLADGRELDLDLVPRLPNLRSEAAGGGDLALFTLLLTLMVAVAQVSYLVDLLPSAAGEGNYAYEPSPEYIARLLKQDYEGDEEGAPERAERPEHRDENLSHYLPSGSEGPLDRAGGGAEQGEQTSRAEPEDEGAEQDAPEPEQIPVEIEVPPLAEGELPEVSPPEAEQGAPEPSPDPVERFVGWGFRDWFEVRDARPQTNENLRRELDMVRKRLKIDPNDPYAITTLGYYAYLAENYTLGEEAFQRYIKDFPDQPAGYNNLALIYKRTGEYELEEALYRKALEIDPTDDHVLNNLAVSLGHQGRFDEALEIMELLETLTPNDAYADLHRAKIYAAMGRKERAYKFLKLALDGARSMDTMHHIEFRQDIRLDPAFDALRDDPRWARLLEGAYGEAARELIRAPAASRAERRGRRGEE